MTHAPMSSMTAIQIAWGWRRREVFRRVVLLQGQLPAAADRLTEGGAVEVLAQVPQGEQRVQDAGFSASSVSML